MAYSYTVSCWFPPPGSRESAGPVKGIGDQLLASTAVLSPQRKLPNSRRIHFALIDQLLPSSCSTPTLYSQLLPRSASGSSRFAVFGVPKFGLNDELISANWGVPSGLIGVPSPLASNHGR